MKKEQEQMANLMEFSMAILQTLCEIRDALQQKSVREEELVDTADAKRLLNKSDSALYRMRMNGEIPWKKIGRKIYYPKSFFTNAFKT